MNNIVSLPMRKYEALAQLNNKMFCIRTVSGYRMTQFDPKGAMHLLLPDASDEMLGTAVLDALTKSRFVLPSSYRGQSDLHPDVEFDEDLSNAKQEEHYAAWVQQVMARYGYKTKSAIFRRMKSCGIEKVENQITIRPSHRDKYGWTGDGFTKADYVVIPADSSAEEVGAALRLTFSRCT
jgi:hypothetical protein